MSEAFDFEKLNKITGAICAHGCARGRAPQGADVIRAVARLPMNDRRPLFSFAVVRPDIYERLIADIPIEMWVKDYMENLGIKVCVKDCQQSAGWFFADRAELKKYLNGEWTETDLEKLTAERAAKF